MDDVDIIEQEEFLEKVNDFGRPRKQEKKDE